MPSDCKHPSAGDKQGHEEEHIMRRPMAKIKPEVEVKVEITSAPSRPAPSPGLRTTNRREKKAKEKKHGDRDNQCEIDGNRIPRSSVYR